MKISRPARFGSALLMVALLAGCPAEDVSVGTDTDTDSDGTTTTNKEPLSLPPEGGLGNGCTSEGNISVSFEIGQESSCEAAGTEPFVRYATYLNHTGTLEAGQTWETGEEQPLEMLLRAWWYPDGAGGNEESVSGSLEVVSVTGDKAELRYEFVTSDGQPYEGVANVLICASDPSC